MGVTVNKLATLVINMAPDSQMNYDGDNTLLESYKKRVEDGNVPFPVSLSGHLTVARIIMDENGFPRIECDFSGSLIEEHE